MKRIGACVLGATLLTATALRAQPAPAPLVVTASNEAVNQLLVFSTTGALVQRVPTGGQGGVGGNAGGVSVSGGTVAVVNFGSSTVTLFERSGDAFALTQTIATASAPVSVAFSNDHLYVLGTTTIESHRRRDSGIDQAVDGMATLVQADGSAAQIGIAADRLIIAEKSNTVETVALRAGAVVGTTRAVPLSPDSNAPFGLVTRGANAYVTIAHSDEVALIKNERVVAIAATGTPGGSGQHAPCWIAVIGPYLFTANSPSHSISRLVATGSNVVVDEPVAATTIGAPTDIAGTDGLLAVVDGDASGSRITQFSVSADGTLAPVSRASIAAPINGIGIVR